jgi:hypothetical protein
MTVKTCVVIGHFELGVSEGRVFESAPFGYQCEYATAHHFITTVREMHRASGSKLTITNVVIG